MKNRMPLFRKIKNTFGKKKKLFIVLVIIALLVGLFAYKKQNGHLIVESTKAEKKDLAKYVIASGKTEVSDNNTSYAQVTANIQKLHFKNGDQVYAGALIMELDPASIRASQAGAWSDYQNAKVNLESNYLDIKAAEADEKAKKQVRDNAMNTYHADKGDELKKAALKTAEANYQASWSALDELKRKNNSLGQTANAAYSAYSNQSKNLNSTKIYAPESGKLALEEGVSIGAAVTSGKKVFSVVTPYTIGFTAEVDESDILEIKQSQEGDIELDSTPGKKLRASVSEISAMTKITNSGATAVEVKLNFNDKDMLPIIGLNGEAQIKTVEVSGVIALPYDYIQEDDQGNFVWVIREEKAQKQRIELGIESDKYQEIKSGLNEGDMVIKGKDLKEGTKVKLK